MRAVRSQPTLLMYALHLAGLALLSWTGPATAYGQGTTPLTQLGSSIEEIIDSEAFRNSHWGISIADLSTGEVLFERNAGKSFVPASNVKLFTTAAALEELGPEFDYQTILYLDGPVINGILRGNLIVRGSGDPTISGRYTEGDRTQVFRTWADSLKAAGITRIEGDIIGDDDVFDDVPYGRGWTWDDLDYYYAVEISGLSFNENAVDFNIAGQRPGMAGRVSWLPLSTSYVEVTNNTITTAGGIIDEEYRRKPGTNRIELASLVPAGQTDNESLSIHNPTMFFVHVLRETLLQQGIAIDGTSADVDDLETKPDYSGSLRRVASYTSPPLSEILVEINKESNNHFAEQVFKTIGAVRPPAQQGVTPGSDEAGVVVIREMLGDMGIDTSSVQLVDGSGLSRHNLATPEATVALLRRMWHHGNVEKRMAFYTALPVGGVDGSLETRFTSGAAHNNVRAKTGSMSNVSALSGYVTTSAGTPVAFSILVNHYTASTAAVRRAQDQIVELVARVSD
jgi:serine-type D-Ala-D-Ala carboxypeptidase/endopeptidase (penicillin-binding protein 4)